MNEEQRLEGRSGAPVLGVQDRGLVLADKDRASAAALVVSAKDTAIGVVVTLAAILAVAWSCVGDVDPGDPVSPISPLVAVVATRPPVETPEGGTVITWDYPGNVGPGYVTFVYTSEVKAKSWRLYEDVQLRRATGEVMASQTITTGRQAPDEVGTGDFAVVRWYWDLSTLPPEQMEEWSRTRWSSPFGPDVMGVFLSDDGTMVDQDEEGYSFRRHIWGQGWSVYLPQILRGDYREGP